MVFVFLCLSLFFILLKIKIKYFLRHIVFCSLRIQVKRSLRSVKSPPSVPQPPCLPTCLPPRKTKALARERLVHLLERASSRSEGARRQTAHLTWVRANHLIQQLRKVTVCIWCHLDVNTSVELTGCWLESDIFFPWRFFFHHDPLSIFPSHTHGIYYMDQDHNLQPTQTVVPS